MVELEPGLCYVLFLSPIPGVVPVPAILRVLHKEGIVYVTIAQFLGLQDQHITAQGLAIAEQRVSLEEDRPEGRDPLQHTDAVGKCGRLDIDVSRVLSQTLEGKQSLIPTEGQLLVIPKPEDLLQLLIEPLLTASISRYPIYAPVARRGWVVGDIRSCLAEDELPQSHRGTLRLPIRASPAEAGAEKESLLHLDGVKLKSLTFRLHIRISRTQTSLPSCTRDAQGSPEDLRIVEVLSRIVRDRVRHRRALRVHIP